MRQLASTNNMTRGMQLLLLVMAYLHCCLAAHIDKLPAVIKPVELHSNDEMLGMPGATAQYLEGREVVQLGAGGATAALGLLVNLPKTDILDNLNSGFAIFTSAPKAITAVHSEGHSMTQFFRNSQQFQQQLANDAGLDVGLASLSLSVERSFQAISGFESEVSVAKASARALVSITYATEDVLASLALRPDFLASFRSLPVTVENEWMGNAWLKFGEFIEAWGTHVITAAFTGATFEAYTSSKSSLAYSSQQMEARACFNAEGLNRGIKGCLGFSDNEKREAASLQAYDTRFAKGGTAATRNALLTQPVTADAIEAFLNDAAEDEQPVRYRFSPLWRLMQRRFPARSDDWRRATNLEAFYDGWLGFGCRYLQMTVNEAQVVHPAQWFRFDRSNTGYARCLRRCVGCHSWALDCFWYNQQCFCAGPSCLVPDNSSRGYHIRVHSNRRDGWAGMGCTLQRREDCKCGDTNSELGCNFRINANDDRYHVYKAIWDQTPTSSTSLTMQEDDMWDIYAANHTLQLASYQPVSASYN